MANQQSHLRARFSLDDSLFQRGIKGIGAGVSRARAALSVVGVAALGAAAAIGLVGIGLSQPIAKAAAFEDAVVGFEQLLGGADAARERIAALSSFAASTPFELPQVLQASRILETLTHGALATGKGLRMVGDAASASGQPIEELAVWFGRLYDGLQSGRPVGEALMRLQELGLVSGDVRGKIEKMQKQGLKGAAVWDVVAQSMGRFSGLMDKMSGTWNGKMSNLSDSWGMLLANLGKPVKDALTPFLDSVGAVVLGLSSQGQAFGEKLVQAGTLFTDYVLAWVGAFQSFPGVFRMVGAIWKVGLMEGLVLVRDGFQSIVGMLSQAFRSVATSDFLQVLIAGTKAFGSLFGSSIMAAVPRLWEGLKDIGVGFSSILTTAVQALIQLLFTGIVRVVDYFGQGWSKAIWEPIKSFGARLAELATKFGETIKSFLSANWEAAKASAKSLTEKASEKASNTKQALSETDVKQAVSEFMRGFKANNFETNFKQQKTAVDAADPLKGFFDSMQLAGDKGMSEAMGVIKALGVKNVLDPLAKIFHTDLSLDGARDAAMDDFRKVIESLAPAGRKAVITAVSKLFPTKAPGAAAAGAGKFMNDDGSLNWKSKGMQFSSGGLKWSGRGATGSTLLDLTNHGGLTTSGLRLGNLVNPLASEDLLKKKKAAEDSKKQASEATAVSIRDTLADLLKLNKETWTKK